VLPGSPDLFRIGCAGDKPRHPKRRPARIQKRQGADFELEEKPMTTIWLDNLYQHDMMTITLAGFALAVVLVGWSILEKNKSRFDQILRQAFLVLVLVLWVITLAGCAFVLIMNTGG
jgi:hypothetical protein